MRKALIPLLLVLAVLAAGCWQLDFTSTPAGGDEPTAPTPGGDQPTAPAPGGDDQPTTTRPIAGRLPVFIDSVEILLLESWPVQVKAVVRGTLPTPCHFLAWDLGEPDAGGRIVLSVYSTVDLDQACIQVLHPFEQTIDIGSFTSGSYVLVVNGVEYPFTI